MVKEANKAALNSLGKWAALHHAGALADGNKLIRSLRLVILDGARWPVNLNAGGALSSQSKMQSRIVDREITRLAHHLLRLHVFAIANQHSCANCASIALDPLESNLDPVVARRRIVAQQGRRLVLIHYENIDIAVVVEVAESTSTAAMVCSQSRAPFIAYLRESPIAQIAKEYRLTACRKAAENTFQFGIDISGDIENIWPSIKIGWASCRERV